jgi:hypothetical protein
MYASKIGSKSLVEAVILLLVARQKNMLGMVTVRGSNNKTSFQAADEKERKPSSVV